jgi:hypothetical protein
MCMCRLLKFIEVDTHVQQIVVCATLEVTFLILAKSTTELKTDSVFFRACCSVTLCLL